MQSRSQSNKQSLKETRRERSMTWQQRQVRQVLTYTEAGGDSETQVKHMMAEWASTEVGNVTGHREQRQDKHNQNKTGNTDGETLKHETGDVQWIFVSRSFTNKALLNHSAQLHYPTSYLAYSHDAYSPPNVFDLSALLAVHKSNRTINHRLKRKLTF